MLSTIDDMLLTGLDRLDKAEPGSKTRREYYEGKHDYPYAPDGVNQEYQTLREMARVPLVRLAIRTPCQRLRVEGIRTGASEHIDRDAWEVWQANHLDARQRQVYVDGLVYGRGIVSVWPNAEDPALPHIRHESPRLVHVEKDPQDQYAAAWAIKRWQEDARSPLGTVYTVNVALVYTDHEVRRYEAHTARDNYTPESTALNGYEQVDAFPNPLGRVPFVIFEPDEGQSIVDPLRPMQHAIDTMRFNLLLAAQFAAYRQRVVVGYDPVLRDDEGNPIVKKDAEGNPILDEYGMGTPVTASPGQVGVDRLLVFPGADTKVFDVEESNLGNYVTALDMLLATFASTAQVPPQYLAGDFKNVNGDLMAATEATLLSYVADLQTEYGEAWEQVFQLATVARGAEALPLATEVVWSDASPKSLSIVASAMSQMVPNGAPPRMFLEMLPGATQQKVDRWMGLASDALQQALAGDLMQATKDAEAGTALDDTEV